MQLEVKGDYAPDIIHSDALESHLRRYCSQCRLKNSSRTGPTGAALELFRLFSGCFAELLLEDRLRQARNLYC